MNVNVVRLEQWQSRTPPPAPSTPASVLEDAERVIREWGPFTDVNDDDDRRTIKLAVHLARHIQGKEGV